MTTLQHPKGAVIDVSDADADFYLRNGWAVAEDGAPPLFPAVPPPTHEALREVTEDRDLLKVRVGELEALNRLHVVTHDAQAERITELEAELAAAAAESEKTPEKPEQGEQTEGDTDGADGDEGDSVPEAPAPGVRRRTR